MAINRAHAPQLVPAFVQRRDALGGVAAAAAARAAVLVATTEATGRRLRRQRRAFYRCDGRRRDATTIALEQLDVARLAIRLFLVAVHVVRVEQFAALRALEAAHRSTFGKQRNSARVCACVCVCVRARADTHTHTTTCASACRAP